ncbi:hypothetical protein FIBSPDRAFT_887233 [Athelia psychrophila]|uniref:BAH domain-containing protein n=1 Tax=Athelia psychrophila TaxID=1759441 RepID=A0A166PTM7_9AGAM|nr:hypothetical protein FIBSPDRAFT_887233 [Fibularhizoctonia sp. CBS 109695]
MSRKSQSRSPAKKAGRERGVPTPDTWARLNHLQSVQYEGEAYKVGDIVNLAHDSLDSQDLWDARITGIGKKVTQSGTSTWLRVNWFYTAQQINDLKAYSNANWDITAIAPRERVYSNHEGFVSIGSAEGVSDLVQFDERKADIREITGIYYRWAIDIKGGTFQDAAPPVAQSLPPSVAPPHPAWMVSLPVMSQKITAGTFSVQDLLNSMFY